MCVWTHRRYNLPNRASRTESGDNSAFPPSVRPSVRNTAGLPFVRTTYSDRLLQESTSPFPCRSIRIARPVVSESNRRPKWTTSTSVWRKKPPKRPQQTSCVPRPSFTQLDQCTDQKKANNHALPSAGFFSPLNVLLLGTLLYTTYALYLKRSPLPTLPPEPPSTVFRTFTPRTLLPYNGANGGPVYFAVRGRVFDVSAGRNFYGPEGPYANFAGRDATRGLACGSFDESMLTKDLDGPLDTLSDLGPEEMESLRGWEERFESKYIVVGRLVAVGEEGKQ